MLTVTLIAAAVGGWAGMIAYDLVEAFTGRSLRDYPIPARIRDARDRAAMRAAGRRALDAVRARIAEQAAEQAAWQARYAGWARWSA